MGLWLRLTSLTLATSIAFHADGALATSDTNPPGHELQPAKKLGKSASALRPTSAAPKSTKKANKSAVAMRPTAAAPVKKTRGNKVVEPIIAPQKKPSAKPMPNTTGPQHSKLKPSGKITVRKNGAVIENLDVSGTISIHAHNVTIRNVRVRTNSSGYGIFVAQGFAGTVIENVDVQMGVRGTFGGGAIGGLGDNSGTAGKNYGDNVIVRNSYLHGHADGIKAANYSLYEGNYINVSRPPKSRAHVDGIQGSGRTKFKIRYNHIDLAYQPGNNAAVFVQAYTGKHDNHIYDISVHNNWLNGGVFTFHSEDGKKSKKGFLHRVTVNNNIFGRDYKYGAVHREGDITGNFGVWADNRRKVPTGALR